MRVPFTYGNVYDEVGDNHGTNNGAVTTQDRFGVDNMAYYFDGASYIVFGDHASTSLDNLNSLTISVWISPDNAFAGMRTIIAKWNVSTNEQYGLYQDGLNGIYAVRDINNAGSSVSITPNSSNWYHIVFTLDKTSHEQKLYIDNVLVTTSTPGGTVTATTESTALSVGAQYNDTNGSGASPNRFFQGAIDDIQLFDRVLSATEIDSLFNADKPVCEGFEIELVQSTNTGTNTGAFTFNVNGGHAPYSYSVNGGINNSMVSSKVCVMAGEGNLVTLTAPGTATFRSVNFASFGDPSGTCLSYIYANCHAPETFTAVQDSLLGNQSGDFMGSNSTFGYDPCFGTGKNTRIMASYSEDVEIVNLIPGNYLVEVTDSLGCHTQMVVNIQDLSLGIEANESLQLEVYPNPAGDQIVLQSAGQVDYILVNLVGEEIFSGTVTGMEVLDITGLSPGVYLIKTLNNQVIKVVKQ